LALTVSVPDGLVVESTDAPERMLPRRAEGDGRRYLVWHLDNLALGISYEYEVKARVAPASSDLAVETRATVAAKLPDGSQIKTSESATIAVSAKGSYLKWLPALYQRDELMGRFLMLFESFWRPIEQRIAHIDLYLDPRTAPKEFLPWLASWLGLVLDDQLDEAQRRTLIRAAASLYRQRGTRQGLIDYLQVLGESVRIIEHSADNMVLGPAGRLGPSVALGTENVPHTFTVIVQGGAPAPADGPAADERLRRIRMVIEAEKPAHTGYLLRYESQTRAIQMEG
jgi:phage tail-like protein